MFPNLKRLLRTHRSAIVAILLGMGMLQQGCGSKPYSPAPCGVALSGDIVARQFAQWQRGEGNFFDLLHDDVIWTVSGRSPVSGTYKGKACFMNQAVAPVLGQLRAPLVPELIDITTDNKYVWLHFKARATTLSGRIYENTYLWKLQLEAGKIIRGIAFLDTHELVILMKDNRSENRTGPQGTMEATGEYLGMWVTKDGHIRHELLPNGRYDESRGTRKSAYRGRYKVTGNHIDYRDDTGFTADGEFKDGILYHAGMILYKE